MTKGNKKASNTVRKVTPGDHSLSAPLEEAITKTDKSSSRPSKKRPSEEDSGLEQMDSQLELIVQGYNSETVHSPKRSNVADEKLSSSIMSVPVKKQKIVRDKQEDDVLAKQRKATVAQGKKLEEVDPKPTSVDKSPPVPLCSPKKRGRKKAQSPKSSPESSPAKKVVFAPKPQAAAPESNNSKVEFLGVTIMDKRTQTNLPSSCYQPRNERPTLLVEQLPSTTVGDRLASAPAVHSSFSTEVTNTTESVHFKWQCDERRKLAAKHRAEHEMVRKKVLHSIRYVLSTWDIELDSNKSHGSIVESAKKWFDEALVDHQELLNDMLDRQTMEAESLAARQTAELTDKRAPMSHISFPFPEVFEQAQQEMLSFFSKN